MEEVGTQVAPPLYMYNTIGGHQMAKKRSLTQQQQQQQYHLQRLIPSLDNSWNPKNWEWDSSRLVAKPLDMTEIPPTEQQQQQQDSDVSNNNKSPVDDEGLLLKLGGSRPTKRVRSGSPGSANYPMCQVDNCNADLSAAKDYHRRHKVCEVHSKAGKAMVGKQMQRFCQQCSRFHPLSEFDEGKRSCRRRLAGHNRRRRKTQPDDVLPGNNGDKNGNGGDMDIVNLLTVLACAQGNTKEDMTTSSSPLVPNKDQLMQILNKINSLPLPVPVPESQSKVDRNTMDLLELHSGGGERSSTSFQSDSDCQTPPLNLQLQLFSSSPEDGDDSPPKLASSRKYFSSDSSSNRSPSSSPPLPQTLFPTKASTQRLLSTSANRNKPPTMSLELFGGTDNISIQSSPYTSSSGSHQSPSSLNSDPQDRTGRILFKLFDKDPSHLPGSLRTQIYNWLSQSPSEMEGYIRPGCVVLSVYLSMSSSSWDHLERNFLQYIRSLLQDSTTDFWGNGRFLAHTQKHIASHKDGKLHLFKSLKAWSTPQLISVSPLAVVAGKETCFLLRGRNLRTPGTNIYCTHANRCMLKKEVTESVHEECAYEEISTRSFTLCAPSVLGRCFIEIENGYRSTSFPIIIADAHLCQELKLLEAELGKIVNEEILHFLNELGWLFQRKGDASDYSLTRFKFLLVFSVERDFCGLVKTLLGILLNNYDESCLEMLSGINLLSRAVKRRCKNMVDLLINYSTSSKNKYIFPPNLVGPGGMTPLHLVACTSNSDDMVEALTNDPQEIGVMSWNSCVDANGLSPFAYAAMKNDSYNTLVARKLADRIAGQVSLEISNEIERNGNRGVGEQQELSFRLRVGGKSCSRCAVVAAKHPWRIPGSQGLLHRPYIHSMLAIAAVCVCVCLFLRGAPDIGLVAPFKWENLNFGSM